MTFLPDRPGAFPVEETREVEIAGRGDVWAARERTRTVYYTDARPIPGPEPERRPAPRRQRGSWVVPFVAGFGAAIVVSVTAAAAFGQLGLAAVLIGVYLLIAALLGLRAR